MITKLMAYYNISHTMSFDEKRSRSEAATMIVRENPITTCPHEGVLPGEF